ncbi:MAG: GtrA family protein [Phycisphaerae bacterium]
MSRQSAPQTSPSPPDADKLRARLSSFIRFCGLTVLSAGVNFGLAIFLHEVVHFSAELAYGLSLITVFVMNFFIMRHFIFAGGRAGHPGRQLALHAAAAVGFRGGEYLAFLGLHTVLGLYYIWAMITVQTASFFAKYVFYGTVVFGSRASSAPPADET